jgi:hypothetical protein
MKKFASLFLILTLFYNVLGYYVMLADKAERTWVSAMEKIDNSKFEVIKMDINPYAYIFDSGFEYVSDDIIVNKKTYHVFKNRILNNVLHLYCLRNSHQDAVNKDLKNIVDEQLYGTESSKENPSKKILKSFIKDYILNEETCFVIHKNKFNHTVAFPVLPNKKLLSGYFNSNYPPPDFF